MPRDHFEDRKTWIEAGMALKVAYGDEAGFDLWNVTHIDDQARQRAPADWASFAATAQSGHVTIGTIMNAAKDTGFVFNMMRAASPAYVLSTPVAPRNVSYGPFTMDANTGLTKQVKSGRGKKFSS
jgi:hypothetical protein